MSDPVTRFSSRVENYAKYRPTYPAAVIDILTSNCGLSPNSVIADVGSGTGILSRLLLENGNTVFGIEPNPRMRLSAEQDLWRFNNFLSVAATAEATTLKSRTLDFVTAAQAFHWFDQAKAKKEFARIIRPRGWVVLLWNERRVDSTPFLRAYESLLLRYGTDYARVRHENVGGDIEGFYSPKPVTLKSIENLQHFDLESLKGRTRSASYTPEPGNANFEPMFSELEEIFAAHNRKGMVTVEYDTRVYYGRL
ncbi:MAG: class I SAM-dependent methyltransferase [Pyrinomonadaceae bacterium]|nr:class I SAM-dependent methyltransferase [Pyrinomonadaceae bacterium]